MYGPRWLASVAKSRPWYCGLVVMRMYFEWRLSYVAEMLVLAMHFMHVHKVLTEFGRPRRKRVDVFVDQR